MSDTSDLGDQARRQRGKASYAELLDVPADQIEEDMAARVGHAFADEVFLAAGRPPEKGAILTDREHSIAVITALVAQGVTGDRLETHLDLAHRQGISHEAMTQLMILLAAYLGQPRASLAMESVLRVQGRSEARGAAG